MSASPKKTANADQIKNPGKRPGRPSSKKNNEQARPSGEATPNPPLTERETTAANEQTSSRSSSSRLEWVSEFVDAQLASFKLFETSLIGAITVGFKAQAEREDALYKDMEEEQESERENPDLSTSQYQAKRHCSDHQVSNSESNDPMDALLTKTKAAMYYNASNFSKHSS